MTTLERLRHVPLFADLLESDNDCPAFFNEGTVQDIAPGQRVVEEGSAAAFYVILEGELMVLKKSDQAEVLLTTHPTGSFFGELPMLLGTGFFAAGKAVGPVKVWVLQEEPFWRMLAACPGVTRQIMQTMAFRVKSLESMSQGHEKLLSLGTMAAGLAHELDNPAAGTRHAALDLKYIVGTLPHLACKLHKRQLQPDQLDLLAQIGQEMQSKSGCNYKLTPMQRSDAEDAVATWLEEHGVERALDLAPTYVAAGYGEVWLEDILSRLGPEALETVVEWFAVTLGVDGAVKAIEEGTLRISKLVEKTKHFTHMDQSPVGEVEIGAGLESTLTILGHKLNDIQLRRDIDPKLPTIWGYAGELNQVWTNLLANAADAVEGRENPTINVKATCEGDAVLVEVEDNGKGMSPEATKHLFEPFYTTKPVGKGTGLGLATSYRIVHGRHGGTITVKSTPGCTRVRVTLPLALVAA